jgi:hypothetical protein
MNKIVSSEMTKVSQISIFGVHVISFIEIDQLLNGRVLVLCRNTVPHTVNRPIWVRELVNNEHIHGRSGEFKGSYSKMGCALPRCPQA